MPENKTTKGDAIVAAILEFAGFTKEEIDLALEGYEVLNHGTDAEAENFFMEHHDPGP